MSGASHTPSGSGDRELFLAALEIPAEERAAFLDLQCGPDMERRQRVEALLVENSRTESFLDRPAVARADGNSASPGKTKIITTVAMPPGTEPGERIGRYKLLQQIGEGGCGIVYMAEQEEPVRRRVALKIIKLGMDTKGVIARFEAERQALAMMDHPNIARVLDAGATETGRPYFVMELVRGIKITEYADQNNLSTEERLKLFIQVCNAIQHAHQKGIIHRDIKPSNIMVTLHDGVPVPKVIDFGIAKAIEQKLTDKTLFTQFQAFIGTPAYMSPEQAEMSGLDIDTRSDIYSLGVLLYEILTGETPFDAEALISGGLDECRKTIREKEPARPSTRLATMIEADLTTTAQNRRTDAHRLIHLLQGDLDWIVMKCLEKDRTRRYETATELAADVERYLSDEAVLARPPSNIYRLKKFFRKHRAVVSTAAAIATILVVGTAVSTWLAIAATKAENQAKKSATEAEESAERAQVAADLAEQKNQAARLNEYVADISLAQQSLKDKEFNLAKAVQLLEKHVPTNAEPDLRGFEWRYLWERSRGDEHDSLPRQRSPILALALSQDGRLAALSTAEGVSVWNLGSRIQVQHLPGLTGTNNEASRILRQECAFIDSGRKLLVSISGRTRVWDTSTWKELPVMDGELADVADDGNQIAVVQGWRERGGRGGRRSRENREGPSVAVLSTSDWSEIAKLPAQWGRAAFSKNGDKIVTETEEGLKIWDLKTGAEPVLLEASTNVFEGSFLPFIKPLAFSPNGKIVVASRNTPTPHGVFVVTIWDAITGAQLGTLPDSPQQVEHTGIISSLTFAAGKDANELLLATGSLDHSIRLWKLDNSSGKLVGVLHGHLNEVWTLRFTPDGQQLISGAKDGSVNIWTTQRPEHIDEITGLGRPLGFSNDGHTLATVSREPGGRIIFTDLANRKPMKEFSLPEPGRGFRRSGNQFALSSDLSVLAAVVPQSATNANEPRDSLLTITHTGTGESNVLHLADRRVDNLKISPDGRYLIAGGNNQMSLWYDLRAGTNTLWDVVIPRFNFFGPPPSWPLFSPDSRLVYALQEGKVQIWTVEPISLRCTVELDESLEVNSAAFSPDGTLLALAYSDHTIGLLDTTTGKEIGNFTGHKQPAYSVAFSPDGRTLASAGHDSTLRLWNVQTQQELITDRRLGNSMTDLRFSPDGEWLIGAAGNMQAETMRFYYAPEVTATDIASRRQSTQIRGHVN